MSVEVYTRIDTYKETTHKSIYLVKNEIDGLIYIQRVLKEYNLHVYQILKEIHSPYIPEIYEIIKKDNELIIIEEFINAPTLEQCILNNEISEKDKPKIIDQLLDAVTILHENRIIHRDIKPENIFYYKGNIILFDYDISRQYQPTQYKDTTVLGSVGYAAPEQFGFQQTDERTDIYAIGVFINYLYTSALPSEYLYQGEYKKVIEKATHIDPEKRYQSVKELRKALGYKQTKEWTLPGFRKGKLFNQIIACIGYGMMIWFALDTTAENAKPWSLEDILVKLMMFILQMIFVFYMFNYCNIRQYSLLKKSHYRMIRIFGMFLSMSLLMFLVMVIGSFILVLFQ